MKYFPTTSITFKTNLENKIIPKYPIQIFEASAKPLFRFSLQNRHYDYEISAHTNGVPHSPYAHALGSRSFPH